MTYKLFIAHEFDWTFTCGLISFSVLRAYVKVCQITRIASKTLIVSPLSLLQKIERQIKLGQTNKICTEKSNECF